MPKMPTVRAIPPMNEAASKCCPTCGAAVVLAGEVLVMGAVVVVVVVDVDDVATVKVQA